MFFKSSIMITILVVCVAYWLGRPDEGLPSNKISGIVFLDSNHGFIQQETLSHPEAYETLDGGKTWKRVKQGVPGFRTGRAFATRLTGWSISEKNSDGNWKKWAVDTVYQTEDGGSTWKVSLQTNRRGDFAFGGIQAISETEVWVVGISGAYHSVDRGKTWYKSGSPGTGLQFLDARRGWLQDDRLQRTANGGRTWEIINSEDKPCFRGFSFFFLNDQLGWAVSGGTEGNRYEDGVKVGAVIATSDGGRTCKQLARLAGQLPWSVFFLNEREGWIGGVGTLLKTEDGGLSWNDVLTGRVITKPE